MSAARPAEARVTAPRRAGADGARLPHEPAGPRRGRVPGALRERCPTDTTKNRLR
jgi:hypothetical protein